MSSLADFQEDTVPHMVTDLITNALLYSFLILYSWGLDLQVGKSNSLGDTSYKGEFSFMENEMAFLTLQFHNIMSYWDSVLEL